jgi:hypothetical protein
MEYLILKIKEVGQCKQSGDTKHLSKNYGDGIDFPAVDKIAFFL